MSFSEIKNELRSLEREAEVLSYKTFWNGEDYARNREIRDQINYYNRLLKNAQ